MQKKIHIISFTLSGFFLFLDQILKYFFLQHQTFSWYVIKPWLGLEYFENPGIAFGIPVPGWLVLVYTPFVLLAILLFLAKKNVSSKRTFALSLILAGAISNFVDRVFFEFTIDYIRIVTSILNIADILIIVGAVLLLLEERHKKNT